MMGYPKTFSAPPIHPFRPQDTSSSTFPTFEKLSNCLFTHTKYSLAVGGWIHLASFSTGELNEATGYGRKVGCFVDGVTTKTMVEIKISLSGGQEVPHAHGRPSAFCCCLGPYVFKTFFKLH
ncbi:hypothetical protein CEXT_25151 [Caerostris extrusa]|uniref:Uncharacterized protein n=1 Tax=Caerostris extrusa TaxID=172846 RepID=A0AAV4QY91_CAEEX|nr:hypothetical protein CEXT_25151 [Caerostris extrusa]